MARRCVNYQIQSAPEPALELELGPRLPSSWLIVCIATAVTVFVTLPIIIERTEANIENIIASISLPSIMGNGNGISGKAEFLGLPAHEPLEVRQLTGFISGIIKTTKNQKINPRGLAEVIVAESRNANYDPLFVASVILAESSFRPTARSSVGALGLMQIRPRTGRYVSELYKIEWTGAKGLHNPQYNVRLGIAYLKHLEEMFNGDMNQVLVAYNWGPTNLIKAIKRRSKRIPSSSLHYSNKIIKNYRRWKSDFNLSYT